MKQYRCLSDIKRDIIDGNINRIQLVNEYLNKNKKLINQKSFVPMDKTSHLSENSHSKIFTIKIVDEINKILSNNY